MSPVSVATPSPAATKPERRAPFFKILVTFCLLIVLGQGYEIWLTHSGFAGFAADEIVHSARVRAEFGEDVRLPLAVGWSSDTTAYFFGYVRGAQAQGYATVNMIRTGNQWSAPDLRVHDLTEDHVVNLSAAPTPATPEQLHGTGRLYIVPLGESAREEVTSLATTLRDKFSAPAQVLPTLQLPAQAYDPKRRQWIAEMLPEAMAAQFPEIAADPESKIVGIIDGDIYLRGPRWRFAYNYRFASKYAVIPTARLDPAFYGHRPSPAIRRERLEKIVAKNVGILYFGFQTTVDNLQSVMLFAEDPHDMDNMSGQYLPSDVQTQPKSPGTEGAPCLTFSIVNVAGLKRQQPIHACHEGFDLTESSLYEVDLTHGEFRVERNDLYRTGPMPLVIRRLHSSHAYQGKRYAFGKSTWQNLDDTVWSTDPSSIQTINVGGVEFRRSNATPGIGFSPDAKYIAPDGGGDFSNALLSWEGGKWKIQNQEGTVWHYLGCGPDSPVSCYFIDKTSLAGDSIHVIRNPYGEIDKVEQKTNPGLPLTALHDHVWTFTYDGRMIQRIEDSDGSIAAYSYDADGYFTGGKADGHTMHYDYDQARRINHIVEDGKELRIHYDNEGRANELDFPGQISYRIRYSGETVEVAGPDGVYQLEMREGFFRTTFVPTSTAPR